MGLFARLLHFFRSFILLFGVLICVVVAGIALYKSIDQANQLTELRLAVPVLARELKEIQEDNVRLEFEIEKFSSPANLLILARKPEYGHLKYPVVTDILQVNE